MNKKNPFKLDWRSTLSSAVIGLGTMVLASIPAAALPIGSEIKLSQVGFRSHITIPTPLNLRPRIHIPSSRRNYSRYRNRRYIYHYGGCSYYGNCRHPRFRRRIYRKRSRNKTKIIIINPDNHRTYRNHRNNGYIRVIKK